MTLAPPAEPGGTDELVVEHTVVETRPDRRRRLISGTTMLLAGLICVIGWGVGADSGDAAFGFSEAGQRINIPDLRVPGEAAAVVLGAIILVLGGYQLVRGFTRRRMRWVLPTVVVLFVLAFLCWAGHG